MTIGINPFTLYFGITDDRTFIRIFIIKIFNNLIYLEHGTEKNDKGFLT